ncbi:MAG: hypothetical protein C4547_16315 [Phycisphaerales bacterium]|nr:MAG: hypothetical protein C4547_16315 [Phycisphaerales bacterium]
MALKLFSRQKEAANPPSRPPSSPPQATPPKKVSFEPAPQEVFPDDPLLAMLQMERFSVLVHDRDVTLQHADGTAILQEAISRLESQLALVPHGIVNVPRTLGARPGEDEEDVEVKPYLLAIHTVTNAQFQKFVDAGCYEDLKLWPEDIWPHLIELHDQTDRPGPRYWREGRHDRRLSDHPVVGISWYEARAYAKWVGLRLPTEAEWQMAASWHIKSSADILRRFPWGDAMDATRCNIWLSGRGGTCPVDAYPEGAAPNRVLQLVGNVWEWTSTEFQITDDDGNEVFGEMPMYTIRGAAFDTYFEAQATAEFRTGQISLARAHNVGFRCAMDLSQAVWLND